MNRGLYLAEGIPPDVTVREMQFCMEELEKTLLLMDVDEAQISAGIVKKHMDEAMHSGDPSACWPVTFRPEDSRITDLDFLPVDPLPHMPVGKDESRGAASAFSASLARL